LQYLDNPKYYNLLFDAWETKYHKNREDGKQIIEQGNSIVKRYKDMVEQTGKPADPYSKDYKDTMKASREVYQREPKGFLDRLEEKAATKVLVENTAKAWGDWWTGGKK
jgi:hypothetical protein